MTGANEHHFQTPRAAENGAATGTILVVDDEVLIRMTLSEDLADAGYTCLEAGTGREALRLLEENPQVALLITDVGLPDGFDGWQVAEAARANRPELPVLLITGYADQTALVDNGLTQRTAVMTKPFRLPELLEKVAALIAG